MDNKIIISTFNKDDQIVSTVINVEHLEEIKKTNQVCSWYFYLFICPNPTSVGDLVFPITKNTVCYHHSRMGPLYVQIFTVIIDLILLVFRILTLPYSIYNYTKERKELEIMTEAREKLQISDRDLPLHVKLPEGSDFYYCSTPISNTEAWLSFPENFDHPFRPYQIAL